jgi:predicted RNA polymerase sigma factor
MTDSPIVRLNHAAAIAMADGPGAGLAALNGLEGLGSHHLQPKNATLTDASKRPAVLRSSCVDPATVSPTNSTVKVVRP